MKSDVDTILEKMRDELFKNIVGKVAADPSAVAVAFPYQPGCIVQANGRRYRVQKLDTWVDGSRVDVSVALVPLDPWVNITVALGDNIMDFPEGAEEESSWSGYKRASPD